MRTVQTEDRATTRNPESLRLLDFYWKLSVIATRKSRGKGYRQGTRCRFTRKDIEEALRRENIDTRDMQAAIDHCVKQGWLELKEDGTFRVTNRALADYHSMLRRI